MKIGVLIPCYNEAAAIAPTVKGVLAYLPEVLVVDDGSTDATSETALQAGAEVLKHSRNQGKGAALRTGFEHIKKDKDWDAVIIMDGDGQHDYLEIPEFVTAAEKADIVLGNRMDQATNMPRIRWLTNKVTSWIISRIVGQKVPDSQCGYRLIKTAVLDNIVLRTTRYDTESEILLQAASQGYSISSIPIKSLYGGEPSYINPRKDTLRFMRLIKTWLCQ